MVRPLHPITCGPRVATGDANEPPDALMVKDIAVDEILAACGDAETVTLKPGEILFREGDDARAMYVVNTVQVCGASVIPDCAQGMLSDSDDHIRLLEKAVKDRLAKQQTP